MGKILRVNLSDKTTKIEDLDENLARNFIGGRGLGVKIIYDEVPPGTHPLSEENKIVVATGPLTGTKATESGRYCTITKSPLTGTIHDSHSGGSFGFWLKSSGFDAIIIEGKSDTPVYLLTDNGKAEIIDASHLWGKTVFETSDALEAEYKPCGIACIGPAGEKLSKIACIMNEKYRAAGRGGHGAVLGSKKLKAIVSRGNQKPEIKNPEKFDEACEEARKIISEHPVTSQALPSYGTAVLVNIINEHGMYPTRNFQTGVFEGAEPTSGETIAEKILIKKKGCWGCEIQCGRWSKVDDVIGEGPEYETTWSFGADCGVDDLKAVFMSHHLCNEYGLDAIEMGTTIATAMELYEKGYLEEEIKWGDGKKQNELVRMTAMREGIGDWLAEGGYRLAERFGAPHLSMDVKKQALPAYDPRGVMAHALGYATSNRGGCHLRAYLIAPEILGIPEQIDRFSIENKAQWVITFQDLFATVDSCVVCKFVTFAIGAEQIANMLAGATGWDITADEVLKIGERIYNLERAFNAREGFGRKDDTLPKRFLEEPMPEGPSKGHVVPLDKMLEEYYKLRGWVDGVPTPEKLKELGL
ncbi:MAG: aldehyde ferredoxin oxidoreductase family protein [Candidatus Hydrothermarchaeota archaeon]